MTFQRNPKMEITTPPTTTTKAMSNKVAKKAKTPPASNPTAIIVSHIHNRKNPPKIAATMFSSFLKAYRF